MKKLFVLLFVHIGLITSAQIDPQLSSNLQNSLDNCQTTFGIEGIEAALILPDGCTWSSVAGIRAPGVPTDINRKWSFGSCTKAMTAAIIMQLHEEGALDINDPIGLYIDADTILYVDSVLTVKQLLTHTSMLGEIWENGTPLWLAVWANRDSVWNFRNVFDSIYMIPSTMTPGYDYTNTNYMLLGVIIENVTGNTLEQEFQNRIFNPLSMNDSYLGVNGINMTELNGVYNGTNYNGALAHNSYYSTRGGSAYLVSKPMDYARFIRAFHNGDLHLTAILQEAQTETTGSLTYQGTNACLGDWEQYYGYGTEILKFYPNSNDTLTFYGHGGNGLGVSIAVHNPDSNVTFVISGNDYTQLQGSMGIFFEMLCTIMNSLGSNPCALGIEENSEITKADLVKILDLMGREVEYKPNTPLIFVYADGTTEKVFRVIP